MWASKVASARLRGADGRVVCMACEIADTAFLRLRGLLGRRSLGRGEGLLIRPAGAVHTAFMRFPIDVVFLDRELTVIDTSERMGPWRAAGRRRARAVLELRAGEVAARGIAAGERLALAPAEPRPTDGGDVS